MKQLIKENVLEKIDSYLNPDISINESVIKIRAMFLTYEWSQLPRNHHLKSFRVPSKEEIYNIVVEYIRGEGHTNEWPFDKLAESLAEHMLNDLIKKWFGFWDKK